MQWLDAVFQNIHIDKMEMTDSEKRLAGIIDKKLGEGDVAAPLAAVLAAALAESTFTVAAVCEKAGADFAAVLEAAWSWRLLVPVRSSGSAEWDYLVFSLDPADRYALPNLSRHLLRIAAETGRMDVAQALRDVFSEMGAPDREAIVAICNRLVQTAVHAVVTGAQIQAACVQAGCRGQAGAMIAMLKGGGVISPKLADKSAAGASRSPLYELHPCLRFLWQSSTAPES